MLSLQSATTRARLRKAELRYAAMTIHRSLRAAARSLHSSCSARRQLPGRRRARRPISTPGCTRAMTTSRCPASRSPSSRTARSWWRRATASGSWATPTPVDARTLFGIASNTKAFTATALGILVDEGKLRWDAPRHRLSAVVSDVGSLRHARDDRARSAGAPQRPRPWRRRPALVALVHLQPARKSRGGCATSRSPRASAAPTPTTTCSISWPAKSSKPSAGSRGRTSCATRILAKVGMTVEQRAAFRGGARRERRDAACASRRRACVRSRRSTATTPIPPAASTPARTTWRSGCSSSSPRDSSPTGHGCSHQATARQLTTIVTPIPIGDGPPELRDLRPSFNGYGLGFGLRDYRGHKLVTHTGGLPGYVSKVAMMPDAQLGHRHPDEPGIGRGVRVDRRSHPRQLSRRAHRGLDRRLSGDREAARQRLPRRASDRRPQKRDAQSKPSLPLQSYAGKYRDQWYGDIVIARR